MPRPAKRKCTNENIDDPEVVASVTVTASKNTDVSQIASTSASVSDAVSDNTAKPVEHVTRKSRSSNSLKNYFEFSTDDNNLKTAACKLCLRNKKKVTLKMKDSNTSGVQKHLQSTHRKEYYEVNPHKKKTHPGQVTLESFVLSGDSHQATKISTEEPVFTQETFEKLLVEWIAKKYLPFNILEGEESKSLFSYLNKDAVLPKRTSMRSKFVNYFSEFKTCVKDFLKKNISKLSFTIDGWTSIGNKSYYGITVHFIDDNWALHSIALDFVPSNGKHSGKDIANIFFNTLQEYEIQNKVLGVTVDNASANSMFMIELSKLLENFDAEDQHFRCFAHILNLAVQDCMTLIKCTPDIELSDDEEEVTQEDNSTAVGKLRSLFKKLKHSEQLLNKFRSCCETTNTKFISPAIDVSTRWNSTNDMISVGLSVQTSLNVLCQNNQELQQFLLTNVEWNLLSKINGFLRHFKKFSTLLGGDKYVTLPIVVTGFNILLDKVEHLVKTLDDKENRNEIDEALLLAFQSARDKMLKHYRKINWVYCAVLTLDPRHKKDTFDLTSWGRELKNTSIEKFEYIFQQNYSSINSSMDTGVAAGSPYEERKEGVSTDEDELDFNMLFEKQTSDIFKRECRTELDEYYSLKRADGNEDILKWWCKHENSFPRLTRMARDYFSITATSVPAERLFSRAGLVITKTRNRLNHESAKSILCLNSWLDSNLFNDMKVKY